MPAVVRILDQAMRNSDRLRREAGDELHRARLAAGLSQRAVARVLGCSASTISRIERGLVRSISIQQLVRHGAVVGLVFRGSFFPLGAAIRDAGQLKVLNRLQAHVGAPFKWVIELLVAPNDLRALDAGALKPGCRIGFDVWSRVRDVQLQARSSLRKQEDAGLDRLILVFGDTAANRRAVRDAGEALRRAFPLTNRQILPALRAGEDPDGNGIVFI
ncbi:MAG TPA: helix-turn-helix transcriptional regulator [Candidatus Limnocylindria bacterium]|nr:helix-turn-helix transcriptional regulator [Candidatus Limnocylindria bacterium]